MSQEEFNQYVQKAKSGDDALFVLIYQVHFESCISFLRMKFKLTENEAYDICMDTMIKFRAKVLNDKISYGNLKFLYTRMASNVFLDSKRKEEKIQNAINHFSVDDSASKVNEDEFLDILDVAMEHLDEENRTLLQEIYFDEKDVHKVAEEMNISYPALRKRKQRMLEKLKSIFKDQLKKI